MKRVALLPFVVLVLVAGCSPPDETEQSHRPLTNDGAYGQYIAGLAQAKQDAGKTVDVASLREEIRLFQVDKGRYPNSLDELVQGDYIKKIPAAPYGMKIDYNPETGDVNVVNQ